MVVLHGNGEDTADFGQMMYKVNGENIAVRASCPLRTVPQKCCIYFLASPHLPIPPSPPLSLPLLCTTTIFFI
ncbi:hypothetical protein [Okeania sp. SIO2B3]|uniref:hypothetical protein n=1 Tax=Okeania sp. SIO2B3 TaxID=2607784 RepID=UPI0013C23FBA|nr:hypothetical protein [Okeania sp. SIO2B3]NET45803.1 hypothetical protein [Okeania sp. SIO2B3]